MMIHLFKTLGTMRRYSAHYSRIFSLFKGFNNPSYCGDKNGVKSGGQQFVDYLYMFFVLGFLPTNYHLLRFDAMDRKLFKNYMDDPHTPLLRPRLWNTLWKKSTFILVHDKYLFHCLCEHHGLPLPRLYGMCPRNSLMNGNNILRELMERNNLKRVVLKPAWGLMGKDIHFVSANDLDSLAHVIERDEVHDEHDDYLVEEVIGQHPKLDTINPNSVNSIRIITFLTPGNTVEFIAAMLRTSSTDSPVDNFSAGGIVIGIDLKTGRLKKEGFTKPPHGKVLTSHPLTGTEFLNFQLPYWEEVKRIASDAQQVFHYIKSIGWDFAVTPSGPVIIEGNQEWGTAGIQAANGGLLTERNRKLFAQYGLTFYA